MGPFIFQLQLQAILAFVHCSCIIMRITLAIVLFAAVGAFALPQKDGGVKEAAAPEKVEKVAVEVEAQTTTAPIVQETKVLKPATIDTKVEEPEAKPEAKPESKPEVTPEERPCVERYRDCLQQAEWVPANIYGCGSNLFTCLSGRFGMQWR